MDGNAHHPGGFTGGDLMAPFLFSGLFRFDQFGEAREVGLFGTGLATLTFTPYEGLGLPVRIAGTHS